MSKRKVSREVFAVAQAAYDYIVAMQPPDGWAMDIARKRYLLECAVDDLPREDRLMFSGLYE